LDTSHTLPGALLNTAYLAFAKQHATRKNLRIAITVSNKSIPKTD
jgi:hypothetical protein